jgi:ArsR family transcriptional regulator, arsenate/arsenite/antimonite-responsive transcriptional repressor
MNKPFKALDDPTRRRILELLRKKDMSAGEIGAKFPISGASVSHHLSLLFDAGLVRREKRGQQVIYGLEETVFQEIIGWLFTLTKESKRDRESAWPWGTRRSSP